MAPDLSDTDLLRPLPCREYHPFGQRFEIEIPDNAGRHDVRFLQIIALHPSFYDDADDLVGLLIVPDVAKLVLDKKQDNHAGGQTRGEPEDIDNRKNLVSPEVAQGALSATVSFFFLTGCLLI